MLLRFICIDGAARWLAFLLAGLSCSVVWGQTIEKALMPGEVIQGHAKYEMECERCHRMFDKSAQAGLCQDCHKDIGRDVASKMGFHGRLDEKDCQVCHEDHKGRGAVVVHLDKNRFDHRRTDFPLNGAHGDAAVECSHCHEAKAKYREAPVGCNDCHEDDDHEKGHRGVLGPKCGTCHSEKNWQDLRFDHEKTRFAIQGGRHADVKCRDCHGLSDYKKTPLTCVGCHEKDDNKKGHKGRYGAKCESCHDDKGEWKASVFDHERDVRPPYPLRGKHRKIKCDACHLVEKGPLYKQKLSVRCVVCHKVDDDKKGHRGTLGEKCESCHSERDWKTSRYDHDKTRFVLRDKHDEAKCGDCHTEGVSGSDLKKLRIDMSCVSCHKKEDDGRKGHRGRYGPKCESCHDAKAWDSIVFNHDRKTEYPLRGKHVKVECDECHLVAKGPIYESKLEVTCISCHRKDDEHKEQLGEKCADCHNEKRWDDVPYDHNKARYPLTGAHYKVDCKDCHATPAYRDTRTTCSACHRDDDKHKRAFGFKCESCHHTRSWMAWDFDHSQTRFKIDGAHDTADCYDCHIPDRDRPVPGTCVGCHEKDSIHDWGLSGSCERCHTTRNWDWTRR